MGSQPADVTPSYTYSTPYVYVQNAVRGTQPLDATPITITPIVSTATPITVTPTLASLNIDFKLEVFKVLDEILTIEIPGHNLSIVGADNEQNQKMTYRFTTS